MQTSHAHIVLLLLSPVSSRDCSVPSVIGKVGWGESECEGKPPNRTERLLVFEI